MAENLHSDRTMDLLVSVRSPDEALAALAGGARLIDVKEPRHGALGRAPAQVIEEVSAVVHGRTPISAALGEWLEDDRTIPDAGLSYVKWGLAGCQGRPDWRGELVRHMQTRPLPRLVLVAYADWQRALAPSLEDVFALAREHPGSVMLVDTHGKDADPLKGQRRPTLLDWLPIARIEDLCARCRAARVQIALAGSLGVREIAALVGAQPNWFAVRGAVCAAGRRQGLVQVEKVSQLVALLKSPFPSTMSVN